MRNLLAILVILLCSVSASATTYYMDVAANGASDANSGLDPAHPWLTPNHAVNCGDVIQAAAGNTYDSSGATLGTGKWGTVTCAAGNNVAWVKCVTFDACKCVGTGSGCFAVSASYWGVQGWEANDTTGGFPGCFNAQPPTLNGANIHHIIFANDVANGCGSGGFEIYNNGSASVDYVEIIGNIAYNAAQASAFCYSGFSVAFPKPSDTLPGTHILVAGNFSYKNFEPSICNGTAPTDGEGVIFDTFTQYQQQAVIENNILFLNGGRGIQVNQNTNVTGITPPATASPHIYVLYNTVYGNNGDTNQNATDCGDLNLEGQVAGGPVYTLVQNVEVYNNLVATNATNGCGVHPVYAFLADISNLTNLVYKDWFYSAAGTNLLNSGGTSATVYASTNTLGTNPSFNNPINPGAPSCSGTANVPACMAQVIANFTPTVAAAKAYGYQTPGTACVYDPLWPKWLDNVNLPTGLVTPGCLYGDAAMPGTTIQPGTVVH